MFLTIFAVVSLKSFAGALILVLFVHWHTLAVVLTRPTATGCLQKEFTVIIQSLKSSLKIQLVLNFMNLGIFVARKADTPHDSAKRTAEYYIF